MNEWIYKFAGFCHVLCIFLVKTKFPWFHVCNTHSFAADGQTSKGNTSWKCSMYMDRCMNSVGRPTAGRPKRKKCELNGWDPAAQRFRQSDKPPGSIKEK